jgi:hypothetical protein
MSNLSRGIIALATIAAVDVIVLQATGNGNSGSHDSPAQRLGFVIFLVSVLGTVGLSVWALARRRRRLSG